MKQFHRTQLARAVSAALTGSALVAAAVSPVAAQEATQGKMLEEIIVTAQKRTENLQDVPISVQVLGSTELQQLNIRGFEDYIEMLPTVSYTSNGPGYGILYMRGISSGGDGVHSGSMPSVAVYVDEQPVTTINNILDVHIYDVARIETLAGPQGTLFGQGSQAGTLRIITNKPVLNQFQASYDVSADTIDHGDMSYVGEGMVNIPLTDNSALRVVGWHKHLGGYIDNVPASITYAASGITIDNSATVEEDFNDSQATGARALLKIDLNDNWTLTPGLMYQKAEAHGIWAHDPEDVGDLEVERFFPDSQDEHWLQSTLTVEGNIADKFNLVYALSHLDRDVNSQYDYTGYAEYLEDVYAYYGYACYRYDSLGNCTDPSQYVSGDETFTRLSHEVRLQSTGDGPFRWIVGAFYQKQEHDFDLQWVIPQMNDPSSSVIEGGNTVWQTKQVRTDQDDALFAELTYDFTDKLSVTGGGRHFRYDNSLYGFNGFIGHCTGFYDTNGKFVEDRVNGTPQYPCFDTRILDDATTGDGESWKGTVNYRVTDDALIYATYSEGFRSGGVNRARVPGIPKYQPDWVINHEIGWKSTWLDGRLRFNGAAYLIDWKDFQYAFLDFSVSNLTIIGNVGQARTVGTEFDLTWLAADNLNLTLAGSYNNAELKEPYYRNSDERDAGFARAPKGQELPFVPKFQGTATARYDLNFGSLPGYLQAAVSYTGASWSDLETTIRMRQDAYTLVNLAVGIDRDSWSLDLFINNVTDERAQIDRYDPGYPSLIDTRTVTNRPRSIGIRFGQRFD